MVRRASSGPRHVAEMDDIVDALRADVSQHGFEREIVSVHVRDGGETHASSQISSNIGCTTVQKLCQMI
jgi:hypothetical protein